MSNSVLSPEPASDALKCSASTRTHWVRKPDWALAAVLLVLVLVLQALSGAYRGDFDANEDEAAHVVSSLMVHDYLVSGKMAHPWRFATDYYVHYPKVAILHWPPLFYSSEAMWMFATSRSRAGLLSFQAVLASTLVIGLFFWMRREHGLWISFVAALVMASNRTMMAAAVEVSPDLLLALLVFWAAAQYGLYIATGESRHVRWAALLAAGALAAHGRAAVLIMVPVITLLLVRVTKKRIAVAAGMVLVYMFVPALIGQAYQYSPAKTLAHSWEYLTWLASSLNWYGVAFAAVGIAVGLRSGQRRVPQTALIALVLSCCIFYSVVNVPIDESYLVTAIPAMIVLAAAGTEELLRIASASRFGVGLAVTAMAMVALGFVGWNMYGMPLKRGRVAQRIVGNDMLYRDSGKIWMVAGDADFEGAIIAEAALRDRAADHIILRASKMLAKSSWSVGRYQMLFHDPAGVLNLLDSDQVGWIISREEGSAPHVRQLEAAVESSYPAWQRVGVATEANLFKRTEQMPGNPMIEIDMSGKFGGCFRFHE